jgi:pimeloyl-ACP methyl ester carboxylesterase
MDATDDEVDDLRDVLQSVKPSVLAGRLGEIITVDVRNGFTEIKVPILLVAGKRDRLVGSKVITQMKLLRPDVEIRVLDAPHMVLQRRPEEAGKLISEFLLKHE